MWRSREPASLLYNFREDGSVILLQYSQDYVVFNFQIVDENLLLFDGMGRMREYTFSICGNRLTLYDETGIIAEQFQRVNSK